MAGEAAIGGQEGENNFAAGTVEYLRTKIPQNPEKDDTLTKEIFEQAIDSGLVRSEDQLLTFIGQLTFHYQDIFVGLSWPRLRILVGALSRYHHLAFEGDQGNWLFGSSAQYKNDFCNLILSVNPNNPQSGPIPEKTLEEWKADCLRAEGDLATVKAELSSVKSLLNASKAEVTTLKSDLAQARATVVVDGSITEQLLKNRKPNSYKKYFRNQVPEGKDIYDALFEEGGDSSGAIARKAVKEYYLSKENQSEVRNIAFCVDVGVEEFGEEFAETIIGETLLRRISAFQELSRISKNNSEKKLKHFGLVERYLLQASLPPEKRSLLSTKQKLRAAKTSAIDNHVELSLSQAVIGLDDLL